MPPWGHAGSQPLLTKLLVSLRHGSPALQPSLTLFPGKIPTPPPRLWGFQLVGNPEKGQLVRMTFKPTLKLNSKALK